MGSMPVMMAPIALQAVQTNTESSKKQLYMAQFKKAGLSDLDSKYLLSQLVIKYGSLVKAPYPVTSTWINSKMRNKKSRTPTTQVPPMPPSVAAAAAAAAVKKPPSKSKTPPDFDRLYSAWISGALDTSFAPSDVVDISNILFPHVGDANWQPHGLHADVIEVFNHPSYQAFLQRQRESVGPGHQTVSMQQQKSPVKLIAAVGGGIVVIGVAYKMLSKKKKKKR